MSISENALKGVLAPFSSNLIHLEKILLHKNLFDQDLSELFVNYQSLKSINTLTLHDNFFHHDDITDLFGFWLYNNLTNMEILSFFNNPGIFGHFPSPKSFINQTTLTHLMIHGCNLYGTLPTNVRFKNLSAITMFDNRLSCKVPPNLVDINDDKDFNLIILPSNLFECDISHTFESFKFPSWMHSSPFINTYSLYLSNYDIVKSYLFGIFSILLTGILLLQFGKIIFTNCKQIKNKMDFQRHLQEPFINDHAYDTYTVASHFAKIKLYFYDKYILLCCVLLCSIYFMNCKYFECILFIDKFGLSYYYNTNN
eukprot:445261_1